MKPTEITINYKPRQQLSDKQKITSSQQASSLFKSIWTDRLEYIEEVYLLLLNRPYHILGWLKLSQGGTAAAIVDVKMIYQASLLCNAHGIILCHNHPSNCLDPSQEDIHLTKRVKDAGKLLDIMLLDHLIITAEGYFSFSDEGMM